MTTKVNMDYLLRMLNFTVSVILRSVCHEVCNNVRIESDSELRRKLIIIKQKYDNHPFHDHNYLFNTFLLTILTDPI